MAGIRLLPHDLNVDLALAGTVELGEDDALEPPQGDLAARQPDGNASAEE